MSKESSCFYTCSLIESICRTQKQTHKDVVAMLGYDNIKRIYQYADVFHCEMIEKVTDDFVERCNIPKGTYDYISRCKYKIPTVWEIGAVFKNIVLGISSEDDDIPRKIEEVLSSWLAEHISNYNSDLYYQTGEYLVYCYKEKKICE